MCIPQQQNTQATKDNKGGRSKKSQKGYPFAGDGQPRTSAGTITCGSK